MDLREYLRILRRHWRTVVSATLLGLLAAGAMSVLVKPTYTAETQLFVAIQSSGSVQELQQGNTFSQARVQSYVKTVATPIVLQPVIDELGLETTPGELARKITGTNDLNTVLITISAVDTSPARAAAIAQGVAASLVRAVDTLERPKTGGTSPVSLSIVAPATAPLEPSAPNSRLNLVLGFILGLAAGIGAAILAAALDSRVRSESDLRRMTDLPILGNISFETDATKKPLLTQTPAQSPRAESFRQLRTNLQFANISGHARSVLVTSSLPGEGKSTTAVNLAIALAQAGHNVCLVDADLRRPMVHDYLGLERNVGLTTALIGRLDANDVLQQWGEDSLYVMTSGEIPPNPSELLGSAEMKDLVGRLELAFDTVVIDAPPLLPVTDAAVLAQHVGGVVVVVSAQSTKNNDLQRSLQGLELVGSSVLGVVMNRLPAKSSDSYAYGYYSHEDHPELVRANNPQNELSGSFVDSDAGIEVPNSPDFERALLGSRGNPATTFPRRDAEL